MVEYTAEDGFNVLTYLGILNLTEKEREVFREKWDESYRGTNQDLIGTIWLLYAEVLPFTCGDCDRGSFMVQTLRDKDFDERLSKSRLDKKLRRGVSLEKIFVASPEKFAINN